jgi:hypothetical protein
MGNYSEIAVGPPINVIQTEVIAAFLSDLNVGGSGAPFAEPSIKLM